MTNSPLKKVFLLLQFGEPHEWTQQYLENIKNVIGGWYWKIFTPNQYKSEKNVEIIPFTLDDFNQLIKDKCGIEVDNWLINGRPRKLTSDYTPAFGKIFEDYIQDFDFWCLTNWDMVYGQPSNFIPDIELNKYDIWADDTDNINGIFTVLRNNELVNNLYTQIPDWQLMFTDPSLFGVDEKHFIDVVYKSKMRFGYPKRSLYFSYDRLEQHKPTPQLKQDKDGALYEYFKDVVTGAEFKKEIMSFHFSHTKKWPI